MSLARILLKLWRLRRWVALGVLLGGVAAAASIATSHSTVYSTATSQMLVDSPDSALANANVDLTGYLARASVFARLMTSDEALTYIGKAAGINGTLIEANGPIEINGSAPAIHAPVVAGGKNLPASSPYELSFVQNPSVPTVDVYAKAPTTAEAIKLANGAVTGFAAFVNQLGPNNVPQGERIDIRQLGQATGGVVDPGASKKIALLVFVAVFAVWCFIVLSVSRVRADLRTAKQSDTDDLFAIPERAHPPVAAPAVSTDVRRFVAAGDPRDAEADVTARPAHRAWATTKLKSRS